MKYESDPLYITVCEMTRFLEEYHPSYLQGLKSIALFDSVVEDMYLSKLPEVRSSVIGFQEESDPEYCPSVHLYIYEIFGCYFESNIGTALFQRWQNYWNGIWFNNHGKHFLRRAALRGIIGHHLYRHNLDISEDNQRRLEYELYSEFLGTKRAWYSNAMYRLIYWPRILLSLHRSRRWEQHLKYLNPTRNAFIEEKRKAFESQQEKEQANEWAH